MSQKNAHRSRLINLLFASLLCSALPAAFAMDQEPSSSAAPRRCLQSNAELCQYGDEMFATVQKGQYERVLEMANPTFSGTFMLNMSDYEHFLFQRLASLYIAYNQLRQKNIFDTGTALAHQEHLAEEATGYLKLLENFTSQVPTFNNRLALHRPSVFFYVGDAQQTIGGLKHSSRDKSVIEGYFQRAIQNFEKSLASWMTFMESDFYRNAGDALAPVISDDLTRARKNLINLNVALSSSAPEEKKQFFAQQAYKHFKDLKKYSKDEKGIESAAKSLEVMEQNFKLLHLQKHQQDFPGSKHALQKTKLCQIQKMGQLGQDVANDTAADQMIGFRENIALQENNLRNLAAVRAEETPQKILDGLQAMENQIASQLLKEATPVSTAASSTAMSSTSTTASTAIPLPEVYKHFVSLLGPETILENYWGYITCFFIAGQGEEGMERAHILENIEKTQRGQLSWKSRFLIAAYKNLQGDNEEWLVFEAAAKILSDQQKQKKKTAKKRAHAQKIEALKASLEEPKKPLEASQETPEKKSPAPKRPVLSEQADTSFEEPTVSAKQLKLEKQQRHEEAEKARQEQEKNPEQKVVPKPHLSATIEPTPNAKLLKKAYRDALLLTSDQSLAQLYGLTSRPLKVDQEIEDNTWRFTREEFNTYMGALHCVSREGQGIHLKSSLPKAIHVLREGYTVMIMNDFGGAATLPAWDKDYVPHYLRKQILEYRKNLRALKILAEIPVSQEKES